MEVVDSNALPHLRKFPFSRKPLLSQGLSDSTNLDTAASQQDDLPGDRTPIAVSGAAFSDQDDSEGDESSSYYDESSDLDDKRLPAAPGSPCFGEHQKSSYALAKRDSLLAEAWERRRERALQEKLANLKEHSNAHLLGRSSSDCGKTKSTADLCLLNRSSSDLGKDNSSSAETSSAAHRVTDDDFEELKGFIDLGFCFDESSLPAFSHTLPALQVVCAVAQSLQESPYSPSLEVSPAGSSSSQASTSPWRVCSPGDEPEDVKGRLRHWARAVACNVRLC